MSDAQEHHYQPEHTPMEVRPACSCGWTAAWIRKSRRAGDGSASTRAYLWWVRHTHEAAAQRRR